MSMSKRTSAPAVLFIAAMTAIFILPPENSQAGRYKLKCNGPYQIVQGQEIATPPCENNYIAKVARSYGYRVTGKQLSQNPNKKVHICAILGHDTRISSHCPYRNIPKIGHRY